MARHGARWQGHGSRRSGWLWGALLVVLGVALLFENLGLPFLTNWWALFILIPAYGAYAGAWHIYQENSRLTRRAAGSLTTGFLLTVLSLIFLFNLTAGPYWPVLLILGGVALLATGLVPE
jgi:hypothetical protein